MKLIIDDAHCIQQELGKNTYVKIPSAINAFISDFEKLVGEGKTMKDC